MSLVPIIIGGCDRSGTTLLASMLGMNNNILAIPESHFVTTALCHPLVDPEKVDMPLTARIIEKSPMYQVWGMPPLEKGEAEKIQGMPFRELATLLVRRYAAKVGKEGRRFWVDHTPSNVMFAGTLQKVFPNAYFIHLVRDGRGVSASLMRCDWGPNTIPRAADFWSMRIANGLAARGCWPADRFIQIRYEDLLRNPDQALGDISRMLGIVLEQEKIGTDGLVLTGVNAASHELVGKDLDVKRCWQWQEELTEEQISYFENLTGELLLALGYEMRYSLSSRHPSLPKLLSVQVKELMCVLVNRLKLRGRLRKCIKASSRDN